MAQEINDRDYSLIRIRDLKVFGHHGVYQEETDFGQNFYVCVDAYQDTAPAASMDELMLTTNYADMCDHIVKFLTENTYKLIETAAEELSKSLLLKYTLVNSVVVEIKKPEAPIGHPFDYVSVVRKMSRHKVVLSLGSNMEDREKHIRDAIAELDEDPSTNVVKVSGMFETEPYGYTDQASFINCAVTISTLLDPEDLLVFVQGIEAKHNRVREIHWGPRTLDIDIIFYDNLVYGDASLQIPHIDMQNRFFVLEPVCEIEPGFVHPVYNKTVLQLLNELREKEN